MACTTTDFSTLTSALNDWCSDTFILGETNPEKTDREYEEYNRLRREKYEREDSRSILIINGTYILFAVSLLMLIVGL